MKMTVAGAWECARWVVWGCHPYGRGGYFRNRSQALAGHPQERKSESKVHFGLRIRRSGAIFGIVKVVTMNKLSIHSTQPRATAQIKFSDGQVLEGPLNTTVEDFIKD